MIAVLWTCEAWYFVTFAAGEIKEPRRNVPLALVGGLLLLTSIYLAVNIAYFYALTLDEMRGVTRIAERAATALVGAGGATFVALTVVISTFGNNVAAMLAGSRLLFGMASDAVFFPTCRQVHPRYRTPHVAIVALTTWSAILALSGSYEQLFTYVMLRRFSSTWRRGRQFSSCGAIGRRTPVPIERSVIPWFRSFSLPVRRRSSSTRCSSGRCSH